MAGDLGRVAELAGAMRDELTPMKGGRVWAAREAEAEPYAETFRSFLDTEDACIFVGTIDDTIIGFGAGRVETLRTGERLGVVTDLFVEDGARAIGVGEAIAAELLAFCRARDCIGVDARALPGHRAAKNFFEEHGFIARAIIMHKPLSAEQG